MTFRTIVTCLAMAAMAAGGSGCRGKAARAPVRLYAGAGLQPAVKELIAAFEKQSGVKVEASYGGSGVVLSRARMDPPDVFLPGDVSYVDRLEEAEKSVAARTPLAWFVPVIIVPKDSARDIRRLQDLFAPDLRVGLGAARDCEIGRVTDLLLAKNALNRSGIKRLRESLTVPELATWVQMKAVDAAIVWDATAFNAAHSVRAIEIPPDRNVVSQVVAAVMKNAKAPQAAGEFVAFMASPAGRDILRNKGYRTEKP
jgi:molybdate transport system substrate-binding protein